MANSYTIHNQVLHYAKGTSDKIYRLVLNREGNNFVVGGWYGRRGSVLRYTEKYRGTDEVQARKKYTKILAEKVAEGYLSKIFYNPPYKEAPTDTIPQTSPRTQPGTKAPKSTKKPKAAKPPEGPTRNISFDL